MDGNLIYHNPISGWVKVVMLHYHPITWLFHESSKGFVCKLGIPLCHLHFTKKNEVLNPDLGGFSQHVHTTPTWRRDSLARHGLWYVGSASSITVAKSTSKATRNLVCFCSARVFYHQCRSFRCFPSSIWATKVLKVMILSFCSKNWL
jgi:hypothetical protein